MSKEKPKRRKIFIDKSFQSWFVGYTMAVVLFTSVIYFSGFYFFLNQFRKTLNDSGLPPSNIILLYFNQQTLSLSLFFMLTFFIIVVLTFFIGLYQSHRIAGPMMKLRNFFNQTRPDDLNTELKFRKNDLFYDLAEAANNWKKKSKEK
ncbi:MAG: hypothetical protein ACXWRZ_16965 [Bdellovibrio sp.]